MYLSVVFHESVMFSRELEWRILMFLTILYISFVLSLRNHVRGKIFYKLILLYFEIIYHGKMTFLVFQQNIFKYYYLESYK
jgi:hypothetical protein